MVDSKPYEVLGVTDSTYLDRGGEAIDGKAVKVRIIEFDEVTTFRVPNLGDNHVNDAAMKYIEQRRLL